MLQNNYIVDTFLYIFRYESNFSLIAFIERELVLYHTLNILISKTIKILILNKWKKLKMHLKENILHLDVIWCVSTQF